MRRKWLCLLAALALLVGWVLWGNRALQVNEWQIPLKELPDAFAGFRIAQVSDLHNASWWPDVVASLEAAEPDLIVLTGDLIDSRNTDEEAALAFARQAAKIAPCCYVTGNHESRVRQQWGALRQGLLDAGVTVLENEGTILECSGETLTLLGLMDPAFRDPTAPILIELTEMQEGVTILLSHRPELMDLYAGCGVDLVFSGHAHGGQVRIPFLGGLIAPNQGFFPRYEEGLYRMEETAMLVSRGVGNCILPLRINNRRENVVAVLQMQDNAD